MPSSRKILLLVAFVATVALIGLTDTAIAAPAPAAVDSITSGYAAKLFKRMEEGGACESEQDSKACGDLCFTLDDEDSGSCHL
ncbi:hypothetical protein BGZ95_005567, partial [Linnemannia exigua]